MVGTASFRLRFRGTSHCLTSVALSKSHYSSPHPYFIQVIGKRHVTSRIVFQYRCQSRVHHQQTIINAEQYGCVPQAPSSLKRSCCHTSACTEAAHELRCATIWHGLLPSHHPSILNQSSLRQTHCSTRFPGPLPSSFVEKSGWLDRPVFTFRQLHASAGSVMPGLGLLHSKVTGLRKFSVAAASLPDGSWNVAWDARPARWLHGRDSAWLLFGVCNCFSAVSSMLSPESPTHVKGISDHEAVVATKPVERDVVTSIQQQEASAGYNVTGIPMDGRCLFRAIAYGACARSGEPAPSENLQQVLADDLRNKVVDELVNRRSESEWFIEEDFDSYVTRMREPYVWGGEPELLMASHVLKMPITVHLLDKTSEHLISVADYGKEYGSQNPIRVLYHGFGHYDALQLVSEKYSTLV